VLKAMGLALLVTGAAAEKAPERAPEKPKLAVMQLSVAGGLDPQVAGALSESVTQEVASAGYFRVISAREVQTLLGFERKKQLLGCSEDSGSCLQELAGAMGARFVMSGTIAKLGDALQLSLQVLDSQKAQPVGRSVRIARDFEVLRAQLPYAVAEACGTPLPPPPSRVLPYSLMAGGGVFLLGAMVLGGDGISRDIALQRQLSPSNTVFQPIASYRAEAQAISTEKTLALASLAVSAGLVTAGLLLNPPDVAARPAPRVALVPSGNGVALVGVLP